MFIFLTQETEKFRNQLRTRRALSRAAQLISMIGHIEIKAYDRDDWLPRKLNLVEIFFRPALTQELIISTINITVGEIRHWFEKEINNKCSADEVKYCIIPIVSFDFFTWFWHVTAFLVFFPLEIIFARQSSHCWRTLHGYKIAFSPTGAWTNCTICNHHPSKLRIIRTKTFFWTIYKLLYLEK